MNYRDLEPRLISIIKEHFTPAEIEVLKKTMDEFSIYNVLAEALGENDD